MRRGALVLLVLALGGVGLASSACYMPKTPTPRVGQTAAPDETSQAQGTAPEGKGPAVPFWPASPTPVPFFPTPRTPGVVTSPAPPSATPPSGGLFATVAPGGQP